MIAFHAAAIEPNSGALKTKNRTGSQLE